VDPPCSVEKREILQFGVLFMNITLAYFSPIYNFAIALWYETRLLSESSLKCSVGQDSLHQQFVGVIISKKKKMRAICR
jgi:hypothetical protein